MYKPTDPKIISSTIGRDYQQPKLRKPDFKDATVKEVEKGALSKVLDFLSGNNNTK